MPRLTCWAYTALSCNSVKMATSAETCSSFNSCNESYFIKRILGECVGCKTVHGLNNNIKNTNKSLGNLRFIKK
jgi:hypothetical protein